MIAVSVVIRINLLHGAQNVRSALTVTQIPYHVSTTSFVNLPVSATEDRVVGTLDIEQAIQKGERHFEPGVLASANRGLLYIDEVNLLDDHVVDVLLDWPPWA